MIVNIASAAAATGLRTCELLLLVSTVSTGRLVELRLLTGPSKEARNSKLSTMLASQQRMLASSRTASRQPMPFVAARSRVQPTIVAKAKLAPLVDAFKADQLRTDLPKV